MLFRIPVESRPYPYECLCLTYVLNGCLLLQLILDLPQPQINKWTHTTVL